MSNPSDTVLAEVRQALPAEEFTARDVWEGMRWTRPAGVVRKAIHALVARSEVEMVRAQPKPAHYRRSTTGS